jgi:hypothetical protein
MRVYYTILRVVDCTSDPHPVRYDASDREACLRAPCP